MRLVKLCTFTRGEILLKLALPVTNSLFTKSLFRPKMGHFLKVTPAKIQKMRHHFYEAKAKVFHKIKMVNSVFIVSLATIMFWHFLRQKTRDNLCTLTFLQSPDVQYTNYWPHSRFCSCKKNSGKNMVAGDHRCIETSLQGACLIISPQCQAHFFIKKNII